jgi:hypothetical protein
MCLGLMQMVFALLSTDQWYMQEYSDTWNILNLGQLEADPNVGDTKAYFATVLSLYISQKHWTTWRILKICIVFR